MQTRIRVNKSLEKDFKNEFWKGLSLKEVGCFAAAFAVLAGVAVLAHFVFDIDYVTGVYIGIPFAFPIILLGFKKFHGMSLMKYLDVSKKKRKVPELRTNTGMPEYKAPSFSMTREKTFAESRGFLLEFDPEDYRKEMMRNFPYSLKKSKEYRFCAEEKSSTARETDVESKEGIIKMDKKHATTLIIVIAVLGVMILAGMAYAGLQVREHWQEQNRKWEYELQLREEQRNEASPEAKEKTEEVNQETEPEVPSIVNETVALSAIETGRYPVIHFSKLEEAEGYTVYRRAIDSEWEEIASLEAGSYDPTDTGLSYTDTGAVSGQENFYTVSAYLHKNAELYQSAYDSTGLSAFYLEAPVIKEVKVTSKGVALTWDSAEGATSYAVYRHANGKEDQEFTDKDLVSEVKETSYTDTKVRKGTRYDYCIMAKQKTDQETHTSMDPAAVKMVTIK